MQLYADIVLPLAQPVYTFAVPGGTDVAAGQAVAVQFGARKFYTGIVWRVHDRRPDFKTVKPIQRVLYDAPLLSAQQMSLWEWIASYYMCSLGEVMRVALPALMKPSGDTEEEFSGDEFRPRTECYVSLAAELRDEGRFHEVCEKIERRAPKQYEALLELAAAGDETRIATGEVARRLLRADYAVLHALERKKYIVCTQRERSVERGGSAFRLPELTAHQLTALNALREQFAAGKTTALLQGVTGSGKTELYIHLIAEALARGGDVLLLVSDTDWVKACTALGQVRLDIARKHGLIDPDKFNFLWVVDFPLFEYSEQEGRWMAMHHPFTLPKAEDLDKVESDPGACHAVAYDIVLNGVEMGGGSMRINDPALQDRMFRALGFTEEKARESFGFLMDAYKFGAPPHGGMAYGLDRMVMLMLKKDSIRDVIAFPKVQNAGEPMSGAPDVVDEQQLKDLSIALTLKD